MSLFGSLWQPLGLEGFPLCQRLPLLLPKYLPSHWVHGPHEPWPIIGWCHCVMLCPQETTCTPSLLESLSHDCQVPREQLDYPWRWLFSPSVWAEGAWPPSWSWSVQPRTLWTGALTPPSPTAPHTLSGPGSPTLPFLVSSCCLYSMKWSFPKLGYHPSC